MDDYYIAPPHSYARPMWRGLRRIGYKPLTLPPPQATRVIQEDPGTPGLAPLAAARGARICPGPMVYTRGEVMSVIVASRGAGELGECRIIAVSGESRTSIIYLRLVLERLGLHILVEQEPHTRAKEILSRAPCALLLGDEALKARVKYRVLADLGALARKVLGINPVFAATMIHPSYRCPRRLSRYEPEYSPVDARETSKATGIPLEEAERYHKVIRLDYNPDALREALEVLGLEKGDIHW